MMVDTPRRSNTTSGGIIDPLDLSFNDIESMAEATTVEPRITSPRRQVKKTQLIEESSSTGKKKCNSLRLSYNNLTNTNGFAAAVEELLENPHDLKWLDLSFNNLTQVDPVWCDYENIRILYLHGNKISDLRELDKLAGLKSLEKLTLHGNSIENTQDYRKYVVSLLPNLKSLDFSTLTKGDRATAECFQRMGGARQKRKTKKERS